MILITHWNKTFKILTVNLSKNLIIYSFLSFILFLNLKKSNSQSYNEEIRNNFIEKNVNLRKRSQSDFDTDSNTNNQLNLNLYPTSKSKTNNNRNLNSEVSRHDSSCYDDLTGVAKKCMPEFVNAAFGLKIIASNTCGLKHPIDYCVQTNLHNFLYSKNPSYENSFFNENNDFLSRVNSRCQKCDANDKRYAHPSEYLNDYNNQGNITWWQSETMLEGIQFPNSVNLTLHLGKSFDINYVQVKFHSPRPESFAIYKRTHESGEWVPYQFYSASCRETYGISPNQIVKPGNEAIALCTDEFSDIAPLTGASVVFGTLEDRPSAYNFENSPDLIEWVTATDIRITLNRLNTFGDEVFNDPQVLKSYYYAISDIAVGGRCKCNGHASKCVYEQQHDFEDRLKCECEHNTDGVDCGECLPFYNDVPWAPATQLNAHECKPCFCNGLSNKCHFNQTLYELTGHGGYCDDCQGNTAGPHCEECKVGFYRGENDNRCINCNCNHIGSESIQCDPNGKCKCRPGVIGEKCDRCAPYHYELSITGCKICNCNPIGSFDSPPICDPRDGTCRCKANVESKNCDRPKPGFFNLDYENLYGALPCFCYGHSSICNSSDQYFISNVTSKFEDGSKNFAIDSKGHKIEARTQDKEVTLSITNLNEDIWFLVPDEFLGNQLNSYNQEIMFELRVESLEGRNIMQTIRPSRKDIVIESSQYNLEVYLPIYGSSQQPINQLPNKEKQVFSFKLNQHSGWMPQLTSFEFQKLLSNISSIKIRASYAPHICFVLTKIILKSAKLFTQKTDQDEYFVDKNGIWNRKDLKPALFIEECKCPIGHNGQRCENCAAGYRREPINGGPFAKCVPCNCNGHSDNCDSNTGKCDCLHHTSGENCEHCDQGYYGNPILYTKNEYEISNVCKKCPCPNDGPCAEFYNYQLQSTEIVCLECPIGTQGNLCELCDDGYYNVGNGFYSKCEKCTCNGNIDSDAIGNCDPQNGKCLKCVYNTTGENCEQCLPNYWGNALIDQKCHSCDCFTQGTHQDEFGEAKQCNLIDGQCECKPNVKNRQCNECKEGYWNIYSGKGCEECKCNPLGSYNLSCDISTGQCFCRPGVQGLKCDSCMPLWYGFSDEGCKKCDCQKGTDPNQFQCDDFGKCKCIENYSGLKCSECNENYYNFTDGCLRCDDCYNLVADEVNLLREKIKLIENGIKQIKLISSEQEIANSHEENAKLQKKLNTLKYLIEELHSNLFEKRKLKQTYSDSINFLRSEIKRITEAIKSTDQQFEKFNKIFSQAERLYNQANTSVFQSYSQINFIEKKNINQVLRIKAIKSGRLDHEQNLKLQHFAKLSRETAENQNLLAQNASINIASIIQDTYESIKRLEQILANYSNFENEQKDQDFLPNYESLRLAVNNVIIDANQQKTVLDQNIQEVMNFMDKIKSFKIPDEKEITETNKFINNLIIELNTKSNSLKKEVDYLLNKFEQFKSVDSIEIVSSAQQQLNNAFMKQKDIDVLYIEAEQVRNKSDSALQQVNEIFSNAVKILDTLEQFDQLILNGKRKIAESEALKPLIENNTYNSVDLLKKIDLKLNKLSSKLAEIKMFSSNTKSFLKSETNIIEKLVNKLSELKVLTKQLEEKTEEQREKFNSTTSTKIQEAKSLYSNFSYRSDSILKEAEQITNRTQKVLDYSNNALENLNKINKSLSEFSVSNINKEEVTRLQKMFEEVSNKLDQDDQLDENISNLEKTSKDLLQTAKQHQYQIGILQREIENLEEINNFLEHKCFTIQRAKPEL